MKPSRMLTGLIAGLMILGGALPGLAANEKPVPQAPTNSGSNTLEQAAAALAEGRTAAAAQGFQAAATDSAAPPFVRSLALLGLARTAWERKDTAAAVKWLRDLAAQEELPATCRDMAALRISEIDRQQKGLPAWDAAAYRTILPKLAKPGAIIHVASASGRAGERVKP